MGVNIDNLRLHVTINNEKEVVKHPNSNFRSCLKIEAENMQF